ncbi:hypothetical protein RA19_18535 [Leisingera sp. ANG-M1]|uniref:tripartite tricarboxylate transporter TctB family protein n=1 Tax=Leisingera sp. ANG-M1 TaxID=1577895 RepID=UPI00057DAEE2|nr:tripartite tricarboxylate transporter TctB family protein [Leisingera sp. ANG-M1]KIC08854.1 hypothetical protein RA19_18535 [Leisingera sp. ANG-M1]
MIKLHRQSVMGIFAAGLGGILSFIAIPRWVATPANVPNIVLSPLFWPYTLAGLCVLAGLGLIWVGLHSNERFNEDEGEVSGAFARVFFFSLIAIAYVWALPVLGMVWASVLAFAATAFLLKSDYPKLALVCAVLFPVVLYGFFAHVAGVAIPQGEFVRLP